ncbi:MAG: putative polymerase epsilon subunit [Actinomycetota bacterium]|jgi:DNA polymerase-3 subunit epsilon
MTVSVVVEPENGEQETVALRDVEFCVVDLETTGGSNEYNSITEIGAVKYRGGEEIGRFTTLVNPQCAIPPFITVLTGITDTMVCNAPAIEEVLDSLLEFVGDSVLVAHNARFDIGFINASLVRDGREKLTNRVLDTVGLARRLVGGEVENCKLSTLAASLGFANQPSHRAINDVLATGDLLHYLIERAAGFGVLDLDDFAAMSKIGTHPQAAKLKMTIDLPRGPGLYLFVDGEGEVLYVGKATNIRARVRSYFGTGDSRRKVGSLLKLMQSIHYISTPDVLSAEVLELRLIARLRPRYNHAFTRAAKYCYVRLTCGEVWPRLMVTKSLKSGSDDIFLGPISSRSMARDFVGAIESVVPLRRCTVRMGKNYRAPVDAPVCSAAQLGLAQCPCSGTAEPSSYAEAVESVIKVLAGNANEVLAKLNAKMLAHSQAQRFEEAGVVLARVEALETVLQRVQSVRELVDAGELSIDFGQVSHSVKRGLLVSTLVDGVVFNPAEPQIDLDFSEFLSAPNPSEVSYPISVELIDEILCIARHKRDSPRL